MIWDDSVSLFRASEIVFVAGDVGLLPVAKRNLKHAARFVAHAAQAVLFVGRNPDFLPLLTLPNLVSNLYLRPLIHHNPQLGAAGVALQ